jgi:putative glycerol-1-phosphate prenyltransferase
VSVYNRLLKVREERGAGYFVLLDPDKWAVQDMLDLAEAVAEGGADALLMGSSLLLSDTFDDIVAEVQARVDIPVIIFPGSVTQVSRNADALLFLSLVSGRNPTYIIGEQVKAAPVIKAFGLEAISTGYMLVESGCVTSAEFMSNTRPIPRDKPDIAKATALAAQYLGMKLIYLEAGSGARYPVPDEMVREVTDYVSIPVIVGGGIRQPEEARSKVESGAAFVVTGNVLEKKGNAHLIREFADAVHIRNKPSARR